MNNNFTYNNYNFKKLSNYSCSYTEMNDKKPNIDGVKLSLLCKNNVNPKNSKMKIENVFIKNIDNKFELDILNNFNVGCPSSDTCYYMKTHEVNNTMPNDKKENDEIKDKILKENNNKKHYLKSHYSSSEMSNRNMYNHYLFNKSYTYLKSKYIKEKNFDLEKMAKNKVAMNNIVDFKNEINIKNVNKYIHNTTCDIKIKKKRISKEKLNEEKSSIEEHNYLKSSIIHNNGYDNSNYVNGLSSYKDKKYNYDLFGTYENESCSNSQNRIKCFFLEKNEFSKNKKYTNNSEININLPQNSMKCYEEICSKEDEYIINDTSQLMEVDLLINSDKRLSDRKENSLFYDYNNSNKFTKFLMAEIKIETKLYKLILFILILILLSLSKNISNYIVITRKCYNVYENPIKSIRRILKFLFIALKICYKFCLPVHFYMVSFLFIIILRIFVILNIPICFLLLYAKFVLRNEESTAKLYFIFLLNIYKYFVFQFSYFLKNFTEQFFLSEILTLIYKSFCLAFICMCKVLQKFYNHVIDTFS
ncbi:conserved Plasmodium protein, unknown function [Plasmodium relictum]|uniref:Uncharacterized protein n=1 Tax=Plasmodium relictum TaxID=85471 RepID=A0A1J1H2F5_PLARL|nr:conserved Plasmodium protein, unknown function [Plasmodium relictum]CRG98743.1 conserved Plasmodium protein, unknown function [Plasmodium relictum]